MTEQEQTMTWPFAESYKEAFGNLPPSQVREAYKRLSTRRRNPLTPEQCAEPSDEVQQTLTAVNAAYLSKKQRSKAASATKRMIQKAHPDNVAAEPEAEPEAEVEAVSDAVAAVSLEPAEITAEEPAPEPEPVVKRSKPIPIPKPVPSARAPAATPMPALALPALAQPPKPVQKSGLGAMLKR